MHIIYEIIGTIVLIGIIAFTTYQMRRSLLKLWREVSNKEIIFHREMQVTLALFYDHKELFTDESVQDIFSFLKQYRRKRKLRNIHLKERQKIFTSLHSLNISIEDEKDDQHIELKQRFRKFQEARRIYNTKVLDYNQKINIFPIRMIAVRMNLKVKEYFG